MEWVEGLDSHGKKYRVKVSSIDIYAESNNTIHSTEFYVCGNVFYSDLHIIKFRDIVNKK